MIVSKGKWAEGFLREAETLSKKKVLHAFELVNKRGILE